MITARRSTNFDFDSFTDNAQANVGLLERQPQLRQEKNVEVAEDENLEQAKARMQRNLDKLLNYDRYSETVVDNVSETEVVAEQVTLQNNVESEQVVIEASSDEDIRPTSTTMQFGDGDIDQMYKEMNKGHTATKESYRLNAKGKLVVLLYSLAVAIILALIIINTSVLASVKNSNVGKTETLNQLQTEYATRMETVDEISSNDYLIDMADDFGMIKK